MSYQKTTWASGDIVSSDKMNNLENEVETLDQNQVVLTESGSDVSFKTVGSTQFVSYASVDIPVSGLNDVTPDIDTSKILAVAFVVFVGTGIVVPYINGDKVSFLADGTLTSGKIRILYYA